MGEGIPLQIEKPTVTALELGQEVLVKSEKKAVLESASLCYQDNQSAIALAKGGPKHKRSKHFGLEYDMFREYISMGEMEIRYMSTDELIADVLTKPLGSTKLSFSGMPCSEALQFSSTSALRGVRTRGWGPNVK